MKNYDKLLFTPTPRKPQSLGHGGVERKSGAKSVMENGTSVRVWGFIVAVVAVVSVSSVSVTQAGTIEELQAQITALLAQLQRLQVQVIQPGGGHAGQGHEVFNFSRDLSLGLRNDDDVRDLQEFLTDQGFYGGPISGNYFLLTVQAVKKFQSANGISPSGYFGVRTRTLANQILGELFGAVCGEDGCDNDVLPVETLTIHTDGELRGVVGKKFEVSFTVKGGSGNYLLSYKGDLPPGLSLPLNACPLEGGGSCSDLDLWARPTIALFGIPQKSGVFDIILFAKDAASTDDNPLYGSERFTFVIRGGDVTSGRAPTISGIKGPTTLRVGEEGLWSVNASDPSGGSLSYAVFWGDEVNVTKEMAGMPGTPFIQTGTFSHTYNQPSIYEPTFIVANKHGLEAKTSITVKVIGSLVGGGISERVRCVFNGSTSEEKCYAAVSGASSYSGYGCSGVGTCVAEVKGDKGDQLTWKSSCGGYAYTVMDRRDEYAEFKCGYVTPLPQPVRQPSFDVSVQGIVSSNKTLFRNQSYAFTGAVTGGLPNSKVTLFLQSPSGKLEYSDRVVYDRYPNGQSQDILGDKVGAVTDASGNWNYTITQNIPSVGEDGLWIAWVTVGGVASNKLSFFTGSGSISPPQPVPPSY